MGPRKRLRLGCLTNIFKSLLVVTPIILPRSVIEIQHTSSSFDGFTALLSNNILSAPVFDGEKYIGFLDIRDLVTFVLTLYDVGFFDEGKNISDVLRSAGDNLSVVELAKKKFVYASRGK